LKTILSTIFAAAILLGGLCHAAPKPNIVLILADDVSADMFSGYGQPGTAKTPNIDRIGREGVQFTTCFAPAICAPYYGKPKGRFYFTGEHRFGKGYKRVDKDPEHAAERAKFEKLIQSLPSHLEDDHPFWTTKYGMSWLKKNPDPEELAGKQLYNHPDYRFYDETD
jgi:hypothetical protein